MVQPEAVHGPFLDICFTVCNGSVSKYLHDAGMPIDQLAAAPLLQQHGVMFLTAATSASGACDAPYCRQPNLSIVADCIDCLATSVSPWPAKWQRAREGLLAMHAGAAEPPLTVHTLIPLPSQIGTIGTLVFRVTRPGYRYRLVQRQAEAGQHLRNPCATLIAQHTNLIHKSLPTPACVTAFWATRNGLCLLRGRKYSTIMYCSS
jgi:hypothetical protein